MDIFMIFMIEYDQENFTVFMSFHKKCIVSSILYSLTLLFRNGKFYWVRKYSKSTRKTRETHGPKPAVPTRADSDQDQKNSEIAQKFILISSSCLLLRILSKLNSK